MAQQKRVTMPDGTTHVFPADATDDQIAQALGLATATAAPERDPLRPDRATLDRQWQEDAATGNRRLVNNLPTLAGVALAPFTGGLSIPAQAAIVGTGAGVAGLARAAIKDESPMSALWAGLSEGGLQAAGAKVAQKAPAIYQTARNFVTRAFKPSANTLDAVRAGNRVEATNELADRILDLNVRPGQKGFEKIQGQLSGLEDEMADVLKTSTGTTTPIGATRAAGQLARQRSVQATPQADLATIRNTIKEFRTNPLVSEPRMVSVRRSVDTGIVDEAGHPIKRSVEETVQRGTKLRKDVPASTLHDIKRNTQQRVRDAYGEMSTASKDAQKALARGLRDDVLRAEPAVGPINDAMSYRIPVSEAAEEAAVRMSRTNPLRLGDYFAMIGHPVAAVGSVLSHPSSQYGIARAMSALSKAATHGPEAAQVTRALILAGLMGAEPSHDPNR